MEINTYLLQGNRGSSDRYYEATVIMSSYEPETARDYITQPPAFAEWFEQTSVEMLGTYTSIVDKFLKGVCKN